MRRVVITGLGALTPIGNNIAAYREGLEKGVSGAGPITYFDVTHFKAQFACEVKDFNPDDFIEKKEDRKLDRFAVYAIVSADEANAASGIKSFKSSSADESDELSRYGFARDSTG